MKKGYKLIHYTMSLEILMDAIISVDLTAENLDGNPVKLLHNETRELSLRLDGIKVIYKHMESSKWNVSDIDNAIFQKNFGK